MGDTSTVGFIKTMYGTLTKILKVGNLQVPILPIFEDIEIGFYLGTKIGFKVKIQSFSFMCTVKNKGGKISLGCQMDLGYLSIVKDAGKWIATEGKKLFDKHGKVIAEFASDANDFINDIGNGAKKIMENLV